MKEYKFIQDWIQLDGDLDSLSKYIYWDVGSEDISMDGSFTLDELKEVVEYMQSNITKEGGESNARSTEARP